MLPPPTFHNGSQWCILKTNDDMFNSSHLQASPGSMGNRPPMYVRALLFLERHASTPHTSRNCTADTCQENVQVDRYTNHGTRTNRCPTLSFCGFLHQVGHPPGYSYFSLSPELSTRIKHHLFSHGRNCDAKQQHR